MNTILNTQPLITSPGQVVALSSLVTIDASSPHPAYLVVNAYDRNEYTAQSTGATGSFNGNGRTLGFSAIGGDARGAGIVFTYGSTTGRYFNSTYGYLDQLTYTASTNAADITALSLFGTGNAGIAFGYATNAISLARLDASGYLGTTTVATEPGYVGTVPTQATPLSIAAVAQTFVGSAWNQNGCWTLTSTISAEAGASLPVQSSVNMAGAANGEWFVAYNGPAGAGGDWTSSVRTGDMIGFITAGGTGHITTCVSGFGSSAMLVDNITYVSAQGTILNAANDGSADDIIIASAHAASQEFAGVSASSVVIYRLDTPVITATATLTISAGTSANLSTVCSASDPAGTTITSYQAYTANGADWFTVNGTTMTATSASTAITASSLSQITFDRGAVAMPDAITVRAYNGTYWGDWTTIAVGDDIRVGSSGLATSGDVSIYRFFDNQDGTHFFTASASEASTILATRSDLSLEGVGLHGYASADASPTSEAVFRFFNVADGTHFYTASANERDALVASPSSGMTFEGTAFYEDAAPQAGDAAVYRFFDSNHGTHLFTASESERASIVATRPDLVSEGIAFYAPTTH